MGLYINPLFIWRIKNKGRILDGIAVLERMSPEEKEKVPYLEKVSSWECVLEEVIDTDHKPEYYARFAKTLFERGYTKEDIQEMRIIAWETAGWFNYEMMAWDWVHLSEEDMLIGLENRKKKFGIMPWRYKRIKQKIEYYKNAHGSEQGVRGNG